MSKFKVSVSKDQKKYSIILEAWTEEQAKNKVHSEWYSILWIHLLDEKKIEWHKFFFQARDKKWVIKKWKIVAKDPFKVFVKLKEWLWYSVELLFSEDDKDISLENKKKYIINLESQYTLFKTHNKWNKTDKEKKKEEEKLQNNLDNFYLKKELEDTHKLIEFVLLKLKNIIDKSKDSDITDEEKRKLEKLHIWIISVKKTTNIKKLREIWEKALLKIWEIELRVLHKYKDNSGKKLLDETNSLLKQVGSKKSFSQESELAEWIKDFFNDSLDDLKSTFLTQKVEKGWIDKGSTSYWKTELLIEKYWEKQSQNTTNILKKSYLFFFFFSPDKKEKLDDLLVRRRVILQNLLILKAKKTGKIKSYTALKKWYQSGVDYIIGTLKEVNKYLFMLIILFSIIFSVYIISFNMGILSLEINIRAIFYFIYVIIFSLLLYAVRWLLTLSMSVVFFIFLFILWVVNF